MEERKKIEQEKYSEYLGSQLKGWFLRTQHGPWVILPNPRKQEKSQRETRQPQHQANHSHNWLVGNKASTTAKPVIQTRPRHHARNTGPVLCPSATSVGSTSVSMFWCELTPSDPPLSGLAGQSDIRKLLLSIISLQATRLQN
ncbi:hypothetical protein E2C01_010037 [Portunus trituberculatus]|uniref:Uncharacterized protein n=1 Tax=Portunus trituberculatus TaxID=210409 RepID=A0A5B7D7B0_PORTR|nr:hypothetical protein [Portunus trituberculatus]